MGSTLLFLEKVFLFLENRINALPSLIPIYVKLDGSLVLRKHSSST